MAHHRTSRGFGKGNLLEFAYGLSWFLRARNPLERNSSARDRQLVTISAADLLSGGRCQPSFCVLEGSLWGWGWLACAFGDPGLAGTVSWLLAQVTRLQGWVTYCWFRTCGWSGMYFLLLTNSSLGSFPLLTRKQLPLQRSLHNGHMLTLSHTRNMNVH